MPEVRVRVVVVPEYKVPSMSEVLATPSNGIRVASLFSGGGGSSCGYRMAGCDVVFASEFIDEASNTYRQNFPSTYVDSRDIRDVSPESVMEIVGLTKGQLDILDGSPPCSSFSMAGNREKGWGEVKSYSDKQQRTDDLFFEYIRMVKGIQPRVFVAENVSGLVKGKARGYYKSIYASLVECGYKVRAKVLDASRLGVPQRRQRLIIIGIRNDIEEFDAYPKPLPYVYTVRDAIGSIKSKPETITCMSKYCTGREWQKLKQGEQSSKYFSLVRAHLDEPCPTITASTCRQVASAGVAHPTECRKFSLLELKRLCSFPDDYQLTGNFGQKGERLGRAVPPVMMMHIATAVSGGLT